MATAPEEVRSGLEVVTAAAVAQVATSLPTDVPTDVLTDVLDALNAALPLIVPVHYDAAGALAAAWYDELRLEASPDVTYDPVIVSEANTAWIDREVRASFAEQLRLVEADADVEFERSMAALVAEAEALVQKEVARGFRDTITGNTREDPAAIGWSRHARPGACKFCRMMARDSVVYRTERAARVAAHTDCHCVARPEFAVGEHGPEASVLQYVAAKRTRTPEERARLREHLRARYPDAPG